MTGRVLIVDLNNFAQYPTLSVGYLAAVCRRAGMSTSVFSPLSVGVRGVSREPRESTWSYLLDRANFLTAQSRFKIMRHLRARYGDYVRSSLSRNQRKIARAFGRQIGGHRADVVMISSYLAYKDLVAELCRICAGRGIPVLVGGPYFANPTIIREWVTIPGLTALAAGEVEMELLAILESMMSGEDPTGIPGVVASDAGGYRGAIARPLTGLEDLPFPDFSDFPWDCYPQRIVPVLTGRGCGWGACTFCSDVTSTAGRTFRTRDPDDVLAEIRHHHETLGISLFVFTDLKLNSDVAVWNRLLEGMQTAAPGSRWVASVHVSTRSDNGLSPDELRAAADAGCVRLTTGLESGSQRVLDSMKKGTEVGRLSDYLRTASDVGISTRCTMIASYPGETAEDVRASTEFVREHQRFVERVKLCQFSRIAGTPIDRSLARGNGAVNGNPGYRAAVADYLSPEARNPAYRRAFLGFLKAIHHLNRRPLRERARVFEGVM